MIFFLAYATIWLLCWGALLASIQSIGDKSFADKHYRGDLAMTCLFAAAPLVNVFIAVFGTGFVEHGWRLSRRSV